MPNVRQPVGLRLATKPKWVGALVIPLSQMRELRLLGEEVCPQCCLPDYRVSWGTSARKMLFSILDLVSEEGP